eukprot:6185211-Pleurochrysis_carterae.AAC.3
MQPGDWSDVRSNGPAHRISVDLSEFSRLQNLPMLRLNSARQMQKSDIAGASRITTQQLSSTRFPSLSRANLSGASANGPMLTDYYSTEATGVRFQVQR